MEKIPLESPSLRAHRSQRTWQILIPFGLTAILIIAAAILVAGGGAQQARQWADVSIIWLAIPLLMVLLFGIIILGGLIYAIARLTKVTPRLTSRVQEIAALASQGTRKAADTAVKPILWLKGGSAMLDTFLKTLLRK